MNTTYTYILGLTLDCNNIENGNLLTEISKINYYKMIQKKIISLYSSL
jgi:hypothetical protein